MINLRKNKKSARGFTLIELLVVIAIIGVLATVVLASLNTARRKSRDARRVTDMKQIQLALELEYDGIGAQNYPTGSSGAANCVAGGLAYGLEKLVTDGYIASVPRDPSTAACYRYASGLTVLGGARTLYHIGAVLEDNTSSLLNNDKDCDDGAAPFCGGVAAFTGSRVIGIMSADCIVGGAAADNCYDVTN